MSTMTQRDRYRVVGNPIAHSRSPQIHAEFARQTGHPIEYDRELIPVEPPQAFDQSIRAFIAAGGRGCNVTLPFKTRAFALATRVADRARSAGAVNTLRFDGDGAIFGDNTDGAGLVADLTARLGFALAGRSVTVLGAGGAARGIVRPLLAAGVARLVVANRNAARAEALVAECRGAAGGDSGGVTSGEPGGVTSGAAPLPLAAAALADAPAADLVINTTSAGVVAAPLALPPALFSGCALAYDCSYAAQPTGFMRTAQAGGAAAVADGLGMLVEQAAESFLIWRGVRPDTEPVYRLLRAALSPTAP
ncbi:MAG: shikimate dehydrogenase [Lautropia sp.]